MATSTFERKLEITDLDSLKKLMKIVESDKPAAPLSDHPYSDSERERSEDLLKRCLSRSKHFTENFH